MTAEALVIATNETRTANDTLLLATIRAARGGDHRAFEELMIATERNVAQQAWRILGDAEEVKEALQETFLRLFRHLGRFDERRDFFAWLGTITINVCRDLQRSRKRRRLVFTPLDDSMPHASSALRADDALAHRDEVALVGRAIATLPERERRALLLRDVEERSTEEVAAILGNTPATVRVQVSRARAKVRQWVLSWRKGARG
jgi:RNA polymerase sigma-70 factor (ECF subfamily)